MQKNKLFTGFSIVIALALLSSAHISYSTQSFDAEPVALEFLNNVVGISLDNYRIISINASRGRMPDSQHFQTNVRIVIGDSERELETVLTFIDGQFWLYRMDLLSGNLGAGQQSLNEGLATVNKVINEYRTRFNAGHIGEFSTMVSTASQTQSLRAETENQVLEIHHAETGLTPLEHTRATWFSKINRLFISPFRSVDVSVSKTGLLTRLTDNMRLYQVATTEINVPKQEALAVATQRIHAYAQSHRQEIEKVDATLQYVPDITSNRGDKFAMYPQWTIMATFKEINEDNVSGYSVLIWADNGKIYNYGPQGSFPPNESSNAMAATTPWQVLITISTAVVLSIVGVFAQHRRRSKRRKK